MSLVVSILFLYRLRMCKCNATATSQLGSPILGVYFQVDVTLEATMTSAYVTRFLHQRNLQLTFYFHASPTAKYCKLIERKREREQTKHCLMLAVMIDKTGSTSKIGRNRIGDTKSPYEYLLLIYLIRKSAGNNSLKLPLNVTNACDLWQ